MDAGAVLAQSSFPIHETETAGELHDRLAADGAPLMLKLIDDLTTNRITETPQDEAQATIAPKLSRAAAKIDFQHSAIEISNQIRGMYPWPGCMIELRDAKNVVQAVLTLARSRVNNSLAAQAPPGTTTTTGIAAGDGQIVEILEVKPKGKRPMPLSAYQNGHPWQNLHAISR